MTRGVVLAVLVCGSLLGWLNGVQSGVNTGPRFLERAWDNPDPAAVGDEVTFRIQFEARTLGPVRVEVEGFRENYRISEVSGERPSQPRVRSECEVEQRDDRAVCIFSSMGPGERGIVVIEATAVRAGEHEIRASAERAGGQGPNQRDEARQSNTVNEAGASTETPTPEPTETATPTATASPSVTPNLTPTETPSASPAPTETPLVEDSGDDDGIGFELPLVLGGVIMLTGGVGLLLWARSRPDSPG